MRTPRAGPHKKNNKMVTLTAIEESTLTLENVVLFDLSRAGWFSVNVRVGLAGD